MPNQTDPPYEITYPDENDSIEVEDLADLALTARAALGAAVAATKAVADGIAASVIVAMTTTQRDALTGASRPVGRTIYNTTTGRYEGWSGTAWVALAPAFTGVVAMSTAQRDALTGIERPVGRIIYNTTTGRHEGWSGSAWVLVAPLDVTVKTTQAVANNTAPGQFTVPLGVSFSQARIGLFGSINYGIYDITTAPADTFGHQGGNGYSPTGSLENVNLQMPGNNGATALTRLWLSGTSLIIQTTGNGASTHGAHTFSIIARGRTI